MVPRRFRPRLTALEGRELPAALLQVINDSPYPAAARLDIYINGLLVPELTDLQFRKATPYLTQPSAVPLTVSVRPAGGTAAGLVFLNQTVTLAENSATVAVVLGDPAQTSTAVSRFQLLATPAARTQAATVGKAEFAVVHGSPDAPPVDVKVRGGSPAADDVAYASLAPGYASVAPGKYSLDVTLADGVSRVGSYTADLSGSAGKAVTVLASGFVGTLPLGTPEANRFGLLAVNTDGTGGLLPTAAPPAVAAGFAAAGPGVATQYSVGGQVVQTVTLANFGATVRAVTADVTGDGVPDLVVGTGPGVPTQVRVFDGATKVETTGLGQPFEAGFTGGVFLAAGDLDGDGAADVVVTPDQGGGPVAAIFSWVRARNRATTFGPNLPDPQLNRFLGIEDAGFRGGARAAVGDLNGDGTPDLIVAAGFGGGPRVAVYNGKTVLQPVATGKVPARLIAEDFYVFEPTLRNGVYVAAGDITGDGAADLVVGGGPGGGPRVFALNGRELAAGRKVAAADFFAGDATGRDGVRVAVKDLDGDPAADLVVGLGAAGSPQVRGYAGKMLAASVSGTAPPAVAALELNPFANPGAVSVG